MVLYLLMGWLAVVAIKPILALVPVPGILLILAGGIAYTGGLAFFAAQRHPLQPLHLASLRDRRLDLSLLRRALVCSVRFPCKS